ncbi:hypothetical protein [Mesorhizobium sp.]|nr:hypothetical protein [Mesorhizobium sp.]
MPDLVQQTALQMLVAAPETAGYGEAELDKKSLRRPVQGHRSIWQVNAKP